MARHKRIIIFLIILFSVSGKVYSKNPPPGTGTSDVPANILIMLDNSGSMSARLSGAVQIHYPVDVNVDNSGNIYVLEYWNNRIKKFDSSGNYITAFGGYGSNCNQWRNARQFDIKDSVIYISDTSNYRFVTFKYTNLISNSNGCRITFVNSSGFSSVTPSDISLHIKINNSGSNSNNTGWLNANDAVSGVGVTSSNKNNNGTTCLSISGSYVSTSTLKYCYLPSPTTGDLYIRLGIKIGSNKNISYISVQNNLS